MDILHTFDSRCCHSRQKLIAILEVPNLHTEDQISLCLFQPGTWFCVVVISVEEEFSMKSHVQYEEKRGNSLVSDPVNDMMSQVRVSELLNRYQERRGSRKFLWECPVSFSRVAGRDFLIRKERGEK